MTAAVHPAARAHLEALGIIDRYGADALTAPTIVDTLTDKVALLERHDLSGDWRIITVPELGPAWALRWDRLMLAVGDRTEVAYVDRIVVGNRIDRRVLRAQVVDVVDRLGLRGRNRFLYAAGSTR